MESYIRISNINDFLYCPMSIYLHSLYEGFSRKAYQQTPQIVGTLNHANIDNRTYSTARRYLAGLEIYSERHEIAGKLDIYDKEEKSIIERKTHLKEIHRGHRYQLYAQYLCLTEMGFSVEKLFLHSLDDNRRYTIELPSAEVLAEFEVTLQEMRTFDILRYKDHSCVRCSSSIYGPLSW
jgi:CRISPR-associated protein Cas4